MVTSKHLRIYENYGGDGDMLIRTGSNEEKELMNYETWTLIDELIQNLELVEKGLASDNFKSQTLSKLKEVCDNEKTQEALRNLIGKYQ